MAILLACSVDLVWLYLAFREEAGSVEVTFIREGFSMGQGSSHTVKSTILPPCKASRSAGYGY